MPFIGTNPPTNRVAGIYGGASNASLGSAPLNNIVDATAMNLVGVPAWYKDPNTGRISVLVYSQAQASIVFGAALQKVAGLATTLNSAAASTQNGADLGFVMQASTAGNFSLQSYAFAGVAAASVVNTGYYFWRYVNGYVPFAKCGSVIASGVPLFLAPSTLGVLGKGLAAFNASGHAGTSATTGAAVGWVITTSDAADGSMASIFLTGWYA